MPYTQEMVPFQKPVVVSLPVKVLGIVLVLLLSAPKAFADDSAEPPPLPPIEMPTTHLILKTGDGKLTGPNGIDYRLPQGTHVLNPDAWSFQDTEFKRLQEAEVRLTAENISLRKSASEWPMLPVAIGVGIGIAIGGYATYKVSGL